MTSVQKCWAALEDRPTRIKNPSYVDEKLIKLDCQTSSKFVCLYPKCGQIFDKPSNLSHHMRRHSGDKPFLCSHPGCGRRFNHSGILEKHIRSHDISSSKFKNKHSSQRTFHCPQNGCSQHFTARSSLQVHIWSTHASLKSKPQPAKTIPKPKDSSRSKTSPVKTVFACKHPGCNQSFDQGLALRDHLCQTNPGLATETAYYQQLVKGLVGQLGLVAARSPGLTAVLERLPAFQQAKNAVSKMLPVPLEKTTNSFPESTAAQNPKENAQDCSTVMEKDNSKSKELMKGKKRPLELLSLHKIDEDQKQPDPGYHGSKASSLSEDEESESDGPPSLKPNKRVRFSHPQKKENNTTEASFIRKWLAGAKTTSKESQTQDVAKMRVEDFMRRANEKGFHGKDLQNFMLGALEGTGITLPFLGETHRVEEKGNTSAVIEMDHSESVAALSPCSSLEVLKNVNMQHKPKHPITPSDI